MIRTVVLGAVTFLISAGVAVGTARFLGGEPSDLNAALAATLETEHAAVAGSSEHESTAHEGESGLTLMEEVDELLSRIEGVELTSVGTDPAEGADSVAKSTGTPASDTTGVAIPDSAATTSGSDAGEADVAIPAVKAEEARPAPASSGAGAGTAAGTAAGAGGGQVPGLLPEARLGRIFGSMQPRDAARVLEQMDNRDIATILTMLNDRQAASVLSNLAPDRAAAISAAGLGAGEGNR